MKHEPSARPDDGGDDPVEALDVIVELASLPAGTLLTVRGMAQIFGKSPNTIMRAVGEGRLPRPFRIFSENCWRAGDVDVFLQRRMQ
ncbi:MAG: helix-turn-helix domain-containing protein, partial [Candidatus Tectomicrobia bacterium]|nr:helix-turn-helix domain-containing protein [Candidatus Tectomicrobia bacterium]